MKESFILLEITLGSLIFNNVVMIDIASPIMFLGMIQLKLSALAL